jgi:hypothetical protein
LDHFFPSGRVGGDVCDIDFVKFEPGRFSFLVVASDAVVVEECALVCTRGQSREDCNENNDSQARGHTSSEHVGGIICHAQAGQKALDKRMFRY